MRRKAKFIGIAKTLNEFLPSLKALHTTRQFAILDKLGRSHAHIFYHCSGVRGNLTIYVSKCKKTSNKFVIIITV